MRSMRLQSPDCSQILARTCAESFSQRRCKLLYTILSGIRAGYHASLLAPSACVGDCVHGSPIQVSIYARCFPFFSLSFVSEVWKLMSRLFRQSSLPWNVIIALENSEQSQSLHRHTCVTTGYCPTLWSPQTEGLALPSLRCSRMAVHDDPPVEQLMLHLTYSPEF
jgi:hypothetical protein